MYNFINIWHKTWHLYKPSSGLHLFCKVKTPFLSARWLWNEPESTCWFAHLAILALRKDMYPLKQNNRITFCLHAKQSKANSDQKRSDNIRHGGISSGRRRKLEDDSFIEGFVVKSKQQRWVYIVRSTGPIPFVCSQSNELAKKKNLATDKNTQEIVMKLRHPKCKQDTSHPKTICLSSYEI